MSTFQLIPNLSTSQPASAPGVEQRRERVKVTTARGGEEGFDNFLPLYEIGVGSCGVPRRWRLRSPAVPAPRALGSSTSRSSRS